MVPWRKPSGHKLEKKCKLWINKYAAGVNFGSFSMPLMINYAIDIDKIHQYACCEQSFQTLCYFEI